VESQTGLLEQSCIPGGILRAKEPESGEVEPKIERLWDWD
jgi:hypothetical protein